jgi:predicted RNase H-like HicB family nuclease
MSTYEAHVARDGNGWTISVPAVDGSTQAPTISDVTAMAKEHVAVTLDVPLSTVEVHLESLVVDGVGILGRAPAGSGGTRASGTARGPSRRSRVRVSP